MISNNNKSRQEAKDYITKISSGGIGAADDNGINGNDKQEKQC
jgi:hypothetical protein